MKFRHAVGFLICAVGLKFINIRTVLRTQAWLLAAAGWLAAAAGWVLLAAAAAAAAVIPEAYCGLLSLCCGPKISREICAVAYAPV